MKLFRNIGQEIIQLFSYGEDLTVLQSVIVLLLFLAAVCLVAACMVFANIRIRRKTEDRRTRRLALLAGTCTLSGTSLLLFPQILLLLAHLADQSENMVVAILAACFLLFMMLLGRYTTQVLVLFPTLIGPVLLVISVILWIVAFKKASAPRVPESTGIQIE